MKKIKGHKGAAAVEFALVLIPLILILFGIIEFSLLMYNKAVITNASREGARQGALFYTESGWVAGDRKAYAEDKVEEVVNKYIYPKWPDTTKHSLVSFNNAAPVVTPVADVAGTGLLTVTVTYPYHFLLLPNFVSELASDIVLQAVTVMRIEQ